MTKRQAEDVLEREFGTRELLVERWCAPFGPRVLEALRKLGGEYTEDFGVTRMPPDWKKGVRGVS